MAGFDVVLTDLVEEEQNDANQTTSGSRVDQYLDDLEEDVLSQGPEVEAIQEDLADGVEEITSVEDVVLDAVQEEVDENIAESLEDGPFQTGVELYLEDNLEAPVTGVSTYLSECILSPVADEPEVLSGVAQYINNQESDALLALGSSGVSSYLTSIAREKLIAESEAIMARYRAEEELSQSFKKAIKPIVDRDMALAYAEARQRGQEIPSAVTQYLLEVAELDSSLPTLSGVDQYLLQQKFNGGDICSYTGVEKYLITLTAKPDAAPIELEGSGVERYLGKL